MYGVSKQLLAGFIGEYCSTPIVVVVFDCPLNMYILLILSQHRYSIGHSILVTELFEFTLNCPKGYAQTSVIKQLLCQFLRCYLVVSSNPLIECYVIIGSDLVRSTTTGLSSIVPCLLILPIVYLTVPAGIFVIIQTQSFFRNNKEKTISAYILLEEARILA